MTTEHQPSRESVDVLIGGGGFAGLALAVALRQSLGALFSVTVSDPALGAPRSSDARASAIAAGARRLLEAIGAWPRVAALAQPMLDMVITDSRLRDAMRPVFLAFDGEVEPGEPFAHMIENNVLIDALAQRAREEGVGIMSGAVESFVPGNERLDVRLAGGRAMAARLLVGADGARSRIRDGAGIATRGWSYDQTAIVLNVAHEREHEGRAEEHFLPAGPFAVLPLTGRRSSIVWTEEKREAERILTLPADLFHAELEQRFGRHLGDITVENPPRAYPVGFAVARTFVAERIALIGDAAHVIHPIAGQGLNLGLKDVAALAEVIVEAARLGLDPGSPDVLERYQRWRRFDTMAMAAATDALNRLFSNRSDVLRVMRDVGLGVVDRLPGLKHLFIREAAGLVGDIPKLLRGEAL
jgi:2-octaprenyl-6-methoxyphenol hydroxylase